MTESPDARQGELASMHYKHAGVHCGSRLLMLVNSSLRPPAPSRLLLEPPLQDHRPLLCAVRLVWQPLLLIGHSGYGRVCMDQWRNYRRLPVDRNHAQSDVLHIQTSTELRVFLFLGPVESFDLLF